MLDTFPVNSTTGQKGMKPILLFKPGLDCIASMQPCTEIQNKSYKVINNEKK